MRASEAVEGDPGSQSGHFDGLRANASLSYDAEPAGRSYGQTTARVGTVALLPAERK
jgi:hypothetical protein